MKIVLFSCICYAHFTISFFSSVAAIEIVETEPCTPSPCGPYSQCRVVNGHAVCSCLAYCIGTPPACRPECMISSDCPLDKACISSKCQDPCPGTCGINARCQVVNHNPICSCSPGFTGDPFIRCLQEESKTNFFSVDQNADVGKHFAFLAFAFSSIALNTLLFSTFLIPSSF